MAHANARLTPAGRLTLVGRIAAQPRRPIAHIAHEMGISRATAYHWWARYQQLGEAGLVDRPSIPAHSPRRTPARLEQRILRLRRRERLGPARIAARLELPASTVHRVLVRHGCNRLGWLDRPPAGRSVATSTPIPVTWSTWMSRSSAASLLVAGTESMGGPLGRSTVGPTEAAVAMTTCTPRSTTTHGWLMWRSWVMRGPRPAPGSGAAPTAGSPCTASLWPGC
jgi:transposase-like protein